MEDNKHELKALMLDAATRFYPMRRCPYTLEAAYDALFGSRH